MEFDILREILAKEDCETDPRYGCDPEKRAIQDYMNNGVICLDKPSGPSSHQVVAWVKDILGTKAGHSGTLDPRTTGILIIGLGNSAKILGSLLTSDKEYIALMNLHSDIPDDTLKKAMKEFEGEILQKPPLKSSVKRELRVKKIYEMELMERNRRDVLFRVSCEAGTYIRKLCHDLGLVLGSKAHMQELRRIKAGVFDESSLVRLHDLKDAYEFYRENGDEKKLRKCILPMEKAVQNLQKIWIKDTAIAAICHGANINSPGICKVEKDLKVKDKVAVFSLKNELVALGESLRNDTEVMEMDKGMVVDLERVVMDKNIYPKKWGHS